MSVGGQLAPGSTFAGYRIEEEIGRGGMGVVYRATELQLDRPVALKLIAPELAQNESFRQRFLQESRLAASLGHPHILPVFAAGEAEGQLYLAMRYVEGGDLKELVTREGKLPPERALSLLGQVADALDAAHAKGLVHRDVKPANILLDEGGQAYLADFGLTKQTSSTGGLTATGQLMGTLDYLAPEQIRGEEPDGRMDQYALACVLYECLAAEPPFLGSTEAEVLWGHMQEQPPTLPDYPALDSALRRSLSKEKEERYETCGELVAAARQALWLEATEGVATIMFTDVEGSTAFTDRLGDAEAKTLIEAQGRIVREQVAGHGGRVIDSIGDGFMIAFDSTRRGLACAVGIQEALLERAKSNPEHALRLRVGLNVGEVLERDGHPFGSAVNATARIAAVAKGGEVVVSDAVRQLAGTTPGLAFRDRGRFELKGFTEPWRLYEVAWGEGAEQRSTPRRRLTAPRSLPVAVSRRRALLVAGALIVAGGIAALVVSLTKGGDTAAAAVTPNSVAAIDPATGTLLAEVPVGATPTTVATGEGAVWTINADDQTISRIDPDVKSARNFGTHATPTDLAAGEGAVWVGNGVTRASTAYIGPVLASVSRHEPDTFDVKGTTSLASRAFGRPPENRIVVGRNAVWAIRSDYRLSRLDPSTGRVVATLPVDAQALAVARSGTVWIVAGDGTVQRIDPRTHRVTAKVKVGASGLSDIAVGAGAVWVSGPFDGLLFRIDPGPRGFVTRTISVPGGASQLAFGQGAVWLLNSFGGALYQIDPKTNTIARTVELGNTPRDVAVGQGAVWVTVAGGANESAPAAAAAKAYPDLGALPGPACGKVFYGGEGEPQYVIASDLPLRGGARSGTAAMSQAIGLVLRQHRFKAGKYRIAYQSCDDSTAQAGIFDPAKCAANARAYASTPSVIGVVGTFNSPCAYEEIPILNRAGDGPLGMVSPSNSDPFLTRGGRFATPADLKRLYPSGTRNYVRVYPTDDAQAAAHAVLAKNLGLRKVYVVSGADDYLQVVQTAFARAARKQGLKIVGSSRWDPRAKSYADIATKVEQSGADGAFLSVGHYAGNAGQLVKDLRARLGPRFPLLAPDALLPVSALFDTAGPSARGVYVSLTGLTTEHLPPRGQRFVKAFAATQPGGQVDPTAAYAAQSAEVLLDAIARSDGTRASVVKELFATRVRNGILGSFRFDANGDSTSIPVTILRAQRGGGANVIQGYEGASFDRVVYVPPSLLE